MNKGELLHLYELLTVVKQHAEENDMVSQPIDFDNLNLDTQEEYYNNDMYPNEKYDELEITLLHATKTEHKDKLKSLLFNLANGLQELEDSPEKSEDVQKDLNELNTILNPSDD